MLTKYQMSVTARKIWHKTEAMLQAKTSNSPIQMWRLSVSPIGKESKYYEI